MDCVSIVNLNAPADAKVQRYEAIASWHAKRGYPNRAALTMTISLGAVAD
jgi:hypothetical protein